MRRIITLGVYLLTPENPLSGAKLYFTWWMKIQWAISQLANCVRVYWPGGKKVCVPSFHNASALISLNGRIRGERVGRTRLYKGMKGLTAHCYRPDIKGQPMMALSPCVPSGFRRSQSAQAGRCLPWQGSLWKDLFQPGKAVIRGFGPGEFWRSWFCIFPPINCSLIIYIFPLLALWTNHWNEEMIDIEIGFILFLSLHILVSSFYCEAHRKAPTLLADWTGSHRPCCATLL